MVDKVASFVGEKFLPLIVEVWKVVRGVPKQVSEVNEELERIQVFINDADKLDATATNQLDCGIYKKKLKELREAALRIEDVTEDYEMINEKQSQHYEGCAAIPCLIFGFIKTTILRLRISYQIQDINSTILEIKEKPGLLQIPSSSFEHGSSSGTKNEVLVLPPQHALRRNALYVEEKDVVGFEAPRAQLMDWLKEDQINRTVICVVGMGGQGKTTLAKKIFDKVVGDFDCSAWITVSQTYTEEGLLRTMLEKFFKGRKEELSKLDSYSLTNEVRNCLRENMYVIFFDDVWNKDFWSQIQFAAVDNKKRSRIVITTRSKEVANFCKVSSTVHVLDLSPLSPQHSLELFSKKAFRNAPGGVGPPGFKAISSEIVAKCEGLPLAIVAIGGLLASKGTNFLDWQKISQTLISELEKNPNSTGITKILGLSYDDLSYNSKSCFLYFGIYPEDYEIEYDRLIRQWIAEGFVKSESQKTLEEVAQQYLNELVDRNIVQVSSLEDDGKIASCRVHDLLRDMILTKIKDINFCHFIGDGEDDPSMITTGEIRRLKIVATDSNVHSNVMTTIDGSLIRSIYVFGKEKLSKDFVKMILTKCKRLKIADFQDMMMDVDKLECLGNLIHLRYLSFAWNTDLVYLPMSIGNLSNLETLDLRGTYVKKLPRDINKVRKLRHLFANVLEIMEGIGSLEFLQTLNGVKVGDVGDDGEGLIIIKELEKLRQLRSLGIRIGDKKYVSALCSSINKMQHLEKLGIHLETEGSIDWGDISPPPTLHELGLKGKLERFQEWILKYQNIVSLRLVGSNLTEDPLKSLKHLPNLSFLTLRDAYKGESLHFENGEFQNLKKLQLGYMKKLNSINIDEGALSSLKELMLFSIPQLKMVPSGIHHLSKLEDFFIISMPREFCESVQQMPWIHQNVSRVDIFPRV